MTVRACAARELPEGLDPFAVSGAWSSDEHLVLLESADTERGRWSFLGVEPSFAFRAKRSACWAGPPGEERRLTSPPLAALAELFARFRVAPEDDEVTQLLPELPFRGGAMGYLGYELLYQLEDVPDRGRDERPVPDAWLLFFDAVIAFDARSGRALAIANAFAPTRDEARRQATRRAEGLASRALAASRVSSSAPWPVERASRRLSEDELAARGVVPVIPRAEYLALVARAKEHIRAGDVFEICTCNRFDTTFRGSGESLYGALRRVNPAPYAAYLRLPGVEVLSSSPERFLKLDRDGWAETRPIKGTRPRGATPEADRALREALLRSEKDRAENVMIVDLARNDLGRVCAFGTIEVPELQIVESFAFTHQMVSTIRGRLAPGRTPVDLLAAAFPGGSMTGAPKVEAMKIIDGLEPVKRGIFSGSIGYFDYQGAFDLSIVIRTFVKQGDALHFHVGGAIVEDSDAAEEHQEILDKAAGLIAALDRAEERR